LESEFQFVDFSTAEFKKKIPTRFSGIENGIGILLPIGVPEIGTENRNSQHSSPAMSGNFCIQKGRALRGDFYLTNFHREIATSICYSMHLYVMELSSSFGDSN
jgi:hypothetical protein